jgi:Fe-S-cluster containining protein
VDASPDSRPGAGAAPGDADNADGAAGTAVTISAGPLGPWLDELRAALRGDGDTQVPCGECTACCTASQFVHVAPDEAEALAHIPRALLFPAPGAPAGYLVMGYDEQGRCPMLGPGGCTIYPHRPRTCRTYDCRVFAAAGTTPSGPAAAGIAARVASWRFDLTDDADHAELARIRAAAARIADHRDLPDIARALAAITPQDNPDDSGKVSPEGRDSVPSDPL